MHVLPQLGLGTSGNDDPDQCAETVETALEMGYRHIDTAQMYDNEAAVGEGIARADVPREEVFLATKVHPSNLAYDDVLATARESIDRLGVDYVDLLYVHWPISAYDPHETLPAFDELADAGLTRHVGVSNFTADLLETATDVLDAPIVANQVEVHPLLPPRADLVAACDRYEIDIVGYAPFCRGEALTNDTVQAVATEQDLSPAQVCLAWAFEQGVAPIPKATGRDHLADNYAALDVELGTDALARLDAIDRRYRRFDPDGAPWQATG